MTDLQRLEIMVQALLASETGLPTPARVRRVIADTRRSCPTVTNDEAERLALYFEERYGIVITPAVALHDPFTPWLDSCRAQIDPYYWERYRQFLGGKGFPPQVLAEIDKDTDRIVGYLENPQKTGRWDRRGMVMGHVQSGKTGNYIGVATKAADAGYRVIVIIAGVQNKLRNQTQRRVDEGFIGFDTASGVRGPGLRPLGVGLYGLSRKPATFTNAKRDFTKDAAEQLGIPLRNLREPVVFVIKKNPHTLRNLIDWLKTHNARLGTATIDEAMLLIDDEADNASINIKHRIEKISTINGLVRGLLNLFDRSCYVGYTATPFANIFIDPDDDDKMVGDDLFPRDFIVCLNPPSNYFGADQVFRDQAEVVLRDVDDHGDLLPMSHPKDHQVVELPDSLLEAIRVFVVGRAIRLVRKHVNAHNSMLVNVSRFVAVQRQVRNVIHGVVGQIARSVRVNGARPVHEAMRDPEIAELNRVYRSHFGACGCRWDQVQRVLHESVSPIRVVEINSQSSDSLDYSEYTESGHNVIAVGGMSLSRGLTLEGLTVSYILRRSMMYDTLFQMGRWFGYREGYQDLCRVWMPEVARGWYEHIADSIDELRDELIRMQSVNATPRDFGLKVRAHPDSLIVTARNKMGSSATHTMMIGLANRFVETAVLHRDSTTVKANLRAVSVLADRMRSEGLAPARGQRVEGTGGRLVRDVPWALVDGFLAAFKNHPGSPATASEPVREYVAGRIEELGRWDILFAGVRRETVKSLTYEGLGYRLVCQRRAPGSLSDGATLMVTNKRRVASRGVEKVGLTKAQVERAEEQYTQSNPNSKNYPDRTYRNERTKPLLVIHLLAIGEEDEGSERKGTGSGLESQFPNHAA